jgi:hypothetical protein
MDIAAEATPELGEIMEKHLSSKNAAKRIARHRAFWGLFLLGGLSLLGAGCGNGDGEISITIVLTSRTLSDEAVSLSWSGSLSGGEKYDVYKDNGFYASTKNNTITVAGLDPDKRYCFKVFKVEPTIGIVDQSNVSCNATLSRSLAGTTTLSRAVGPSRERGDTVSAWRKAPYPPDGWTLQAVDHGSPAGTSTGVALDSAYRVHVLYGKPSAGGSRLVLASPLGSRWTREVIDANGDGAPAVGISIDGRDGLHMVYWDSANGALKYAGKTSDTWMHETVDRVVHGGSAPSIQADGGGQVHIAYVDALNPVLKYAQKSSDEWRISVVDWTNMVGDGADASMALDSQNRVHIGYYDSECGLSPGEEGVLKWATTDAEGTWQSRVIDRAPALGGFPALAVDSADRLHMAYFDAAALALKYASNHSGNWEILIIDRVGDGIRSVSLTVDMADRVHIAYVDGAQQTLKYATNITGRWTVTVLDRGVYAAGRVSIAADSAGKVYISYIKGDRVNVLTN